MKRRRTLVLIPCLGGRFFAVLRAVCLLVVVTRGVRVTASSPSAVAPVADGAGRQPPVLAGDQQVGISRSALVGVVLLEGRPVPGVHVSLFSASPTNGPGTVCPSCPPDCRKSATTDSDGRFRIEALDPTLRFDVLVHGPGCAPKLLYEVDPGRGPIQVKVEPPPQVAVPEQRVRGRVVDTAGRPIPGAVIRRHRVQQMDGGHQYGGDSFDGLAVTDAQGEFALNATEPFRSVDVQVVCPSFAARFFTQLRGGLLVANLVMTPGASLTGRVLHQGRPVPGVVLGLWSGDRLLDLSPEPVWIRTDSQGRFALQNLPPETAFSFIGQIESVGSFGAIGPRTLRTPKDGLSLDMGDVAVERAHRLAGRVVLPGGAKPPEGIHLQMSVSDRPDRVQLKLDPRGAFEVRGIPSGEVELSFRAPGYRLSDRNPSLEPLIPYRLVGRVEKDLTNLVFLIEKGPQLEPELSSLPQKEHPANNPLRGIETPWTDRPYWKISGRAVDRDTRAPIPSFFASVLRPPGSPEGMMQEWSVDSRRSGTNGGYSVRVGKTLVGSLLVVEAPGYLPATRALKAADSGSEDLLLTRGSGPQGEVRDPEGRPAAGVSVARMNGTWGDPLNRLEFDPSHGLLSVTYPYEHLKFATDASGRFELPALWGGGTVFMVSTQGFALRAVRDLATNPVVTLARYGRITGRLVGPTDRIADQQLHLGFARSASFDTWFRNLELRTVTDAEGRFSFDPAPPGRLEILQLIPYSMERGSWTSRTIHGLELQPGQSLSLELQPARPDEEQPPRSSRQDELRGFILGVMGAVPVIVGFLTVRGFIRRRRQVGS